MRGLRRPSLSRWIALAALVLTWVATVGAGVDAVRTVHEYCRDHQVIEHRGPTESEGTGSEGADSDERHAACAFVWMVADEPPQPPALVAQPMVEQPPPPPAAPPLGGGARAPPLQYAPKTSPPSTV